MSKRSNEQWLAELQSLGPQRETALADLRAVLVRALSFALREYLSPADPNFGPLVEESAQEALLKILDNLHTFRGHSRFTTWAHKIAVHVVLTELRRKRWQDSSLDDLLDGQQGEARPAIMADDAHNPELTTLQADLLRRVQRIIAEDLTDKQRMALVATRIQEQPVATVAAEMGMKENALYKLLHDARLRLKKQLAAEGLASEDILAAFEQ